MRILGESWCFCNGGGKSERMKATIFSGNAPAMARINSSGTGFLIHRNLLLTSHANLPSVAAVEAAEIRLHNGFFITSSVLDLTMVGLDALDGESNAPMQQPHYLKTCSKSNLELGSIVYLLGYTEKQELAVGEGKVVIATDNLIKLSTDGVSCGPGAAGFDLHGNLAFMVCDPMKLATSPITKFSSNSSSSTSSCKKDFPMQFGIPITIIRHWLSQHWEGNLDELNKPKLPLMRLMSSGQKNEHSCASFTMRQVFKSSECGKEGTPTPSNVISRTTIELPGLQDENLIGDPHTNLGIYESPMMTSLAVRKKDCAQTQLLHINFPPRIAKVSISPKKSGKLMPGCGQNYVNDFLLQKGSGEEQHCDREPSSPTPDNESTGSVNGAHSEIKSSSSHGEILELQNEYSSEGETTMYSAETAESRNFPNPGQGRFHQVGRSQSCVNYSRWGPALKNAVGRRAMLEKHRNYSRGMMVYSQGANSQRSNDYFSPTVSSIMKKRNLEQQNRPRPSAVQTSPRWNF
ncbi:hypothetical protein OROGR_024485 [Orobanche gracilis]